MEPVRVLFVDQIPTPYRAAFYRSLAVEPNYKVRVLFCAQPPLDRGWRQQSLDFPHRFLPGITLPGPDHGELYANREIIREIRDYADVIVISGWLQPTCLLAAGVAKASRIPYVIASESHGHRRRPLLARAARRTIFQLVARGAAAGLATGTRAREYMVALGIDEDAVFLFPNACDVDGIITSSDRAQKSGEAAALRKDLAGSRRLVLFVGRLIPTKNVGTLLEALARLSRAGHPVACALAGDGKDREILRRRVHALGLDQVAFLGEVSNAQLPCLYAAADLLCLPSTEEPWGVVVHEALAAGCRVVASDAVGAATDLIRHGGNGAIFPATDADALARAIEDVIALNPVRALRSARTAARSWDFSHMQAGLDAALHVALGSTT
jgi:glycosyltransferase involved in cell wall biosynthesis